MNTVHCYTNVCETGGKNVWLVFSSFEIPMSLLLRHTPDIFYVIYSEALPERKLNVLYAVVSVFLQCLNNKFII